VTVIEKNTTEMNTNDESVMKNWNEIYVFLWQEKVVTVLYVVGYDLLEEFFCFDHDVGIDACHYSHHRRHHRCGKGFEIFFEVVNILLSTDHDWHYYPMMV
jgi:hypothetical protein